MNNYQIDNIIVTKIISDRHQKGRITEPSNLNVLLSYIKNSGHLFILYNGTKLDIVIYDYDYEEVSKFCIENSFDLNIYEKDIRLYDKKFKRCATIDKLLDIEI